MGHTSMFGIEGFLGPEPPWDVEEVEGNIDGDDEWDEFDAGDRAYHDAVDAECEDNAN